MSTSTARLLTLLLIPGLILLVLVVHVLLADGAAATKHDRAAATLSSEVSDTGALQVCAEDCGGDAAADLVTCVLALLGVLLLLGPLALAYRDLAGAPRAGVVRRGTWRLPPPPQLHALSVLRT